MSKNAIGATENSHSLLIYLLRAVWFILQEYQKAIDEFKDRNPDHAKGYYTTDAWWEDEKFQASVKKSSLREEQAIQKVQDDRTEGIEKIAKEWVKREFFRQSMAGTMDASMTEAIFKKSVWDRAMFEGDLKYRQMNGESTDTEAELADFQSLQDRKKQAMLKRAKDELKDILEEDGLLDIDLAMKLESMQAGDDDTKEKKE